MKGIFELGTFSPTGPDRGTRTHHTFRYWSLNPARLPIPPYPGISSFRELLGMRAFLFTQKSARQHIKDFDSRFLTTVVKRSPTAHGLYYTRNYMGKTSGLSFSLLLAGLPGVEPSSLD